MANNLEGLPAQTQVGEVFAAIHHQAHVLAMSIPVFDEEQRESPEEGEVYCHTDSWVHPAAHMPTTKRAVRVSTEHGAPYLFEVWSLHPEDQPGTILPCKVEAFNIYGTTAESEMVRHNPNGLITIQRHAVYNPDAKLISQRGQSSHLATTEVGKLKNVERRRLYNVTSTILGRLAATRCLVSAGIAERQKPRSKTAAQLFGARASYADVYTLLQT